MTERRIQHHVTTKAAKSQCADTLQTRRDEPSVTTKKRSAKLNDVQIDGRVSESCFMYKSQSQTHCSYRLTVKLICHFWHHVVSQSTTPVIRSIGHFWQSTTPVTRLLPDQHAAVLCDRDWHIQPPSYDRRQHLVNWDWVPSENSPDTGHYTQTDTHHYTQTQTDHYTQTDIIYTQTDTGIITHIYETDRRLISKSTYMLSEWFREKQS